VIKEASGKRRKFDVEIELGEKHAFKKAKALAIM
jgi:hypothetical protein